MNAILHKKERRLAPEMAPSAPRFPIAKVPNWPPSDPEQPLLALFGLDKLASYVVGALQPGILCERSDSSLSLLIRTC